MCRDVGVSDTSAVGFNTRCDRPRLSRKDRDLTAVLLLADYHYPANGGLQEYTVSRAKVRVCNERPLLGCTVRMTMFFVT